MKRALDIACAMVGLAVLAPLMAAIAIAIKMGDAGPVFFSQGRVGRFGRPFRMHKFRTMVVNAEQIGHPLTVRDDPRITDAGCWLRRTKLDELPQLWNVLKGEMSLVGPRPEMPAYLDQMRRQAPLVLSVRPGITGPASIKYRREEQLLAAQMDPYAFYDRALLPDKLRINEEYVKSHSILVDVNYLWTTLFPRGQDATHDFNTPDDEQSLKAA
ncbi:MAG: sugar transferase [Pirellulales bacterium]